MCKEKLKNIIIVVGMPRAGTTWLYTQLLKHPGTYLPISRDLNFYGYNHTGDYKWYLKHYRKMKENQIGFDLSVSYFLNPKSLEAMRKSPVKHKIIIIAREEKSWLKSLYNQHKSFDPGVKDFEKFIADYNFKTTQGRFQICLNDFSVEKRIDEFIEYFAGGILLIDFNLLNEDPVLFLNEIEKFTGLDSFFNQDNVSSEKVNSSKSAENFSLLRYCMLHYPFLRETIKKVIPESLLQSMRKKLLYKIQPNETVKKPKEKNDNLKDSYTYKYFKNGPIVII